MDQILSLVRLPFTPCPRYWWVSVELNHFDRRPSVSKSVDLQSTEGKETHGARGRIRTCTSSAPKADAFAILATRAMFVWNR